MKAEVGRIYLPNGTVREVKPENGKKFTSVEKGNLVGGMVQKLESGVRGCHAMYCDMEGLDKKLPPNPFTWIVVNNTFYQRLYPRSWRVLGNILAILTEKL